QTPSWLDYQNWQQLAATRLWRSGSPCAACTTCGWHPEATSAERAPTDRGARLARTTAAAFPLSPSRIAHWRAKGADRGRAGTGGLLLGGEPSPQGGTQRGMTSGGSAGRGWGRQSCRESSFAPLWSQPTSLSANA